MIIVHDDEYYESRKPLPEYGTLKTLQLFIWNTEKRTFLDRTAKEWGEILLFYLCFFTVLGSIFTLQMWLSIRYITTYGKPYFRHSNMFSQSFLSDNYPFFRAPLDFTNPGISFKPNIFSPSSSPMIWLNESAENSRPKRYVEAISNFLHEYKTNATNATNYDVDCVDGKFRQVDNEKPCFFDTKTLGNCGKSPYGYVEPFQPCVFVKFNKRLHVSPSFYNQSSTLPREMPDFLKEIVRSSDGLYVWISCDGANNVDRENIGEIEYLPRPGFPVQFFPFAGQTGYLSPIVALKLKNLTVNRLITIECALWAPRIEKNSLDFQIIIESRRSDVSSDGSE